MYDQKMYRKEMRINIKNMLKSKTKSILRFFFLSIRQNKDKKKKNYHHRQLRQHREKMHSHVCWPGSVQWHHFCRVLSGSIFKSPKTDLYHIGNMAYPDFYLLSTVHRKKILEPIKCLLTLKYLDHDKCLQSDF